MRTRLVGGILVAVLLWGGMAWYGGHLVRRPADGPASSGSRTADMGASGLRPLGVNEHGCMEFENVKDGTILIQVPGATFRMGGTEDERERPVHSVTVPSFLMARVPITNAQYSRFVLATGRVMKKQWQEWASEWGEQTPAVCVDYDDAQGYCAWAGLRLPSEAEWEYAARGTRNVVYPWGNLWEDNRCHSSVGGHIESARRPAPVGSYPLGASPFGCLDMSGNVNQWTSSWFEPYPGGSFSFDMRGLRLRVLRGGGWSSDEPDVFRAAHRGCGSLGGRTVGFRCARDAP